MQTRLKETVLNALRVLLPPRRFFWKGQCPQSPVAPLDGSGPLQAGVAPLFLGEFFFLLAPKYRYMAGAVSRLHKHKGTSGRQDPSLALPL